MAHEPNPVYDVAISFLSRDEGLALELQSRLAPTLETFVYSQRQREIAGTDGLESVRAVFRHKCRLTLILYRGGWGETNWTRVEQEAITDRFLKEGSGFLFVIMLDRHSTPPPWLPDKLIRFNLSEYSVDEAVGAIKLRCQENGGVLHIESLASRAQRSESLAKFTQETETLRRSNQGVNEVRAAAQEVVKTVSRLTSEASDAAPGLAMESGSENVSVAVRSQRVSIHGHWQNRFVNSVDESPFIVMLFNGQLILPGESGKFYFDKPKEFERHDFQPDRTPAYGWCWRDEDNRHLSSEQLAERILRMLLESIDQATKGNK